MEDTRDATRLPRRQIDSFPMKGGWRGLEEKMARVDGTDRRAGWPRRDAMLRARIRALRNDIGVLDAGARL